MSGILNLDLTAEEKLVRARVQLQKEKPFFSYLTMHLTFIEQPEIETAGVDSYGNLYFNSDFINKLTDDEIKGVLAHEVMHCALEHLDRGKGRNHEIFNIAADTVINSMLLDDDMSLPENAINPHNGEITIFGIKIKKASQKTSEEVYDKLYRGLSKQLKKDMKAIKKYLEKNGDKGFDKHIYGDGDRDGKGNKCDACGGSGNNKDGTPCDKCNGTGNKNGKKLSDKKVDWKKTLVDACTYARQRGNLPAGMERIVGKLMETYIDWKGLLYRYITNQIPVDFNWSRPSKRSHSTGIYLPAVEKEMIEVMAHVDTSGSISQKELAEFISELASICNSFKNVDLTVIDCDCRVNGVHPLKNAQASEVISRIGKNLKGGGGTSHIPVFDWINKNKPNTKFVISFTDGYTEFPPKSQVNMPVLWILAGDWRADKKNFPYGQVIELPKRN